LPAATSRFWFGALLLALGATLPGSGERALSAVTAPKPLEVFRDCPECPEMVALTGGTFVMGSELGPETKPVHFVSVQPFAIGKYEVTWNDWEHCMAAQVCREPDDHYWGRGKRPIVNISWGEANAYAEWISKLSGMRYRLPTEAEWEYAARGGTFTEYPWGNDIGADNANCRECTRLWEHQSLEVGLFPANPFGLYDMHGNVWEWIADCWTRGYAGAPTDGRAWTAGDCGRRVLRSGSWYYFPQLSRSASRDSFPAELFSYNIGLRLVRELI
jgi:formylglycine-generating enzyme required for sulfatase activity